MFGWALLFVAAFHLVSLVWRLRRMEGDRVLLAGEPSELETVATFFRGGLPTFPAAWGTCVGYADPAAEAGARWLAARTTATAGTT